MSVEIEFGTLCHAQIICYTFFCSRDIFGFARKLRYVVPCDVVVK